MKRLTDKEVDKLILEIKLGSDATLLIENYRGFVLSIAYRRANATRKPADDLISAGYYGLCLAVENINNFSEGNFLAFIAPYIKGEIENEIAGTLYGPKPSANRKRKYCNSKKFLPLYPKRVPLARDGEPVKQFSVNDFDDVVLKQNWSKHSKRDENINIGELINEVTMNDQEREIIEYRLQGWTDREIAKFLGCSHTKVYLIRRTISERIENEYFGMV